MSEVPTVLPLRDAEGAQAARLLGETFAPDPVFTAILGREDADRVTASFQVELACVPRHAVDVAQDEDGTLLGVGLWYPPQTRSSPVQSARTALAEVRALGLRAARRAAGHQRAVTALLPSGPAWFLSAIAVSPGARGRGVGGLLLRERLARIDADRAAASLEATTAGSRRLYERHGFEAFGSVDGLPGTTSTAMHRPVAGDPRRD